MTVDPAPIADRQQTVSRDDLEMLSDGDEELQAVAAIGDDVKDLL